VDAGLAELQVGGDGLVQPGGECAVEMLGDEFDELLAGDDEDGVATH